MIESVNVSILELKENKFSVIPCITILYIIIRGTINKVIQEEVKEQKILITPIKKKETKEENKSNIFDKEKKKRKEIIPIKKESKKYKTREIKDVKKYKINEIKKEYNNEALIILLINVNRILTKMEEVIKCFEKNKADIMLIQENHLTEDQTGFIEKEWENKNIKIVFANKTREEMKEDYINKKKVKFYITY